MNTGLEGVWIERGRGSGLDGFRPKTCRRAVYREYWRERKRKALGPEDASHSGNGTINFFR